MLNNETRKALRSLKTGECLQQLLSTADVTDMPLRDIDAIARAHRKLDTRHDCKIAFLGNHTLEPLDRFVEATCLIQGISVSSYLGEYDQHFQEILDKNSGCQIFQPDIIFLSLSLRTLSPKIYYELLQLPADQRRAEMQHILSLVSDWITLAKQQTNATLLVSNFQRPAHTQAGVADARLELGEAEFYYRLNLELLQLCFNQPQVYLFDLEQVLSCAGKSLSMDYKRYYLAKMEWAEAALSAIADALLRHLIALLGRTKKCLVLDLDNTLWGGVVGEDGVDALVIGEGSPAGEAFLEFQRYIRALKERGILLAICSKNNLQDVQDVFLNRDDMLLRLDDFACVKINWEHKHINLKNIATDLNIGTDSLVFVDDNPVECALVRQMLPEITTIELPDDPSGFTLMLKDLASFEKPRLTDEDQLKTAQYAQNSQRNSLKREISDIKTFLESLETEITIKVAREKHKARIHQLFSKTNQFNLTTQRYTDADIEQFISAPDWSIHIAQVKDKFGDMGIVGLYLINKQATSARIDSFILSCRAIGRGIETAMMNKIKDDYLIKGNFAQVSASYQPTAKNIPVCEFYENEGFELTSSTPSGEKMYMLNRQQAQLREATGIKVRSV